MTDQPARPIAPSWQPLSARERRVFGVLIEKAKTTPDAYPMSVNALVTGSNQKSNRYPQMELDEDAVQQALDRLRSIGAAAEVQGSSRVPRYRHYAYEWLGVDKVEIAVMAELLLRGAQTEGELRGRAARMEPIADVAALRPVLNSLKAKGLVISLTSEGRGHTLTHALYLPQELERIKAQHGGGVSTEHEAPAPFEAAPAPGVPTSAASAPQPLGRPAPTAQSGASLPSAPRHERSSQELSALRNDVAELRNQLAQLKADVEQLSTDLGRNQDDLQELRNALG